MGEFSGLGAVSCVFEVNAFIKLEILGFTPLETDEKAEEEEVVEVDEEVDGGGEEVVIGDKERSPFDGGCNVFQLLLFSLFEEEVVVVEDEVEDEVLVLRSKLVIDCIGEGGMRCISFAGNV